jgi:hypothetical protein
MPRSATSAAERQTLCSGNRNAELKFLWAWVYGWTMEGNSVRQILTTHRLPHDNRTMDDHRMLILGKRNAAWVTGVTMPNRFKELPGAHRILRTAICGAD